MKKITVAGHICVDVIPKMESSTSLDPGVLVHVGEAAFATGGAVSNTGLALHKLGLPVRLVGKIGSDFFGGIVSDLLKQAGAELDLVVSDIDPTSYSIVLNRPDMDRTFLHCPGANDTFGARDIDPGKLRDADIFHFGYPPLMRAIYADNGEGLAGLLQALCKQGTVTSLDMARPDPDSDAGKVDWAGFLDLVLEHTGVFLPSVDELLFMIDRDNFARLEQGATLAQLGGMEFLAKLADRLMDKGVSIVVIKLGADGLFMACTRDEERLSPLAKRLGIESAAWLGRSLYAPCFTAELAGTTGAGDCTIAGFLAGLAHGLDPKMTMKTATGTGAFSVEHADATSGIPGWQTLIKRINDGWQQQERSIS